MAGMPGTRAIAVVYFASTTFAFLALLSKYDVLQWLLPTLEEDATGFSKEDVWMRVARLLTESELNLFIVLNWVFSATCMFVLATTMLFLGRLTSRESALLMDRIVKYCAFKLMFVSTVRMPPSIEETLVWITWFAVAGFGRIFIGMGRDRLEALMVSPNAPMSAHIRALTLVLLIMVRSVKAACDLWRSVTHGAGIATILGVSGVSQLAISAVQAALGGGDTAGSADAGNAERASRRSKVSTPWTPWGTPAPTGGASLVVLCAYDLAMIQIEASKTLFKYGLHLAEVWSVRRALQQASTAHEAPGQHASGDDQPHGHAHDAPQMPHLHDALGGVQTASWEGKGGLLYHVELVTDIITHIMTIAHYIHMWSLHGWALHVVDMVLLMDVRHVTASLYRRIKQYLEYRTATYCLHHAFPDTKPPVDEPCSICMESMQVAKQLPCGHVFHLSCLRAWLQQSGANTFNCPNCRQPLLVQQRQAAPPRPPTIIQRLQHQFNRYTTILLLFILQRLLELDRTIMQWSMRAQMRAARQTYSEGPRQQGRRQRGSQGSGRGTRRGQTVQAHLEPEGSGESSHPAPVGRGRKMLRKLRTWMAQRIGHRFAWVSRLWPTVLRRRQQHHDGADNDHVDLFEEDFDSDFAMQETGSDEHAHAHFHLQQIQREDRPTPTSSGMVSEGVRNMIQAAIATRTASLQHAQHGGTEQQHEHAGVAAGPSHVSQDCPTAGIGADDADGAVHMAGSGLPPTGRRRVYTRSQRRVADQQQEQHATGVGGSSGQQQAGIGLDLEGTTTRAFTVADALLHHQQQQGEEQHASGQREQYSGPVTRSRLRVASGIHDNKDVPVWSAEVVQTVARSIRSTLAHGDSRAAVAHADEDDGEVVSSRRPRRRRSSAAAAAAADVATAAAS